MQTNDGNRLDGCEFDTIAPGDYRIEFGDASLPSKIDLRDKCTPVEDQGKIGSCTANACVGALEYAYKKRDGVAPDLSRLFVYFNTRRLKGTINSDSGAAINEAMAAVLAFGACESAYWPYDVRKYTQEPSPPAYANGKLHEATQYARVPGASGAMHAIANGYPVVFGTFLPQRLYEVAAQTGRMPASEPEEQTAQPSGGHCMLIVGYDSDARIFIVRNSWGQAWGNAGYCEIPFREMVLFSPPETFWILLELEPNSNFSLIKPGEKHAAPATAIEPPAANLRDDLDQARREIDSAAAELRASLTGQTTTPQQSQSQSFGAVCFTCSGSGKCFFCGGNGVNLDADVNCPRCLGSGRCNSCVWGQV